MVCVIYLSKQKSQTYSHFSQTSNGSGPRYDTTSILMVAIVPSWYMENIVTVQWHTTSMRARCILVIQKLDNQMSYQYKLGGASCGIYMATQLHRHTTFDNVVDFVRFATLNAIIVVSSGKSVEFISFITVVRNLAKSRK